MCLCTCKYCNNVFETSLPKNICDACATIEQEEFEKVSDFLKIHPLSNAIDISDGTKVSTKSILRFIDGGKLHINENVTPYKYYYEYA